VGQSNCRPSKLRGRQLKVERGRKKGFKPIQTNPPNRGGGGRGGGGGGGGGGRVWKKKKKKKKRGGGGGGTEKKDETQRLQRKEEGCVWVRGALTPH